MPELQRLHAGHAAAVLAFELANRSYFAAFISDRGDEFFDQFTERHSALLAGQEAGMGAFYVLVAGDGPVLGRFNLIFTADGTAELGYRVAQHVAGRGVATAAVRELCGLAGARHGRRRLRAAASRENVASQKVLVKAGFVPGRPCSRRRCRQWRESSLTRGAVHARTRCRHPARWPAGRGAVPAVGGPAHRQGLVRRDRQRDLPAW